MAFANGQAAIANANSLTRPSHTASTPHTLSPMSPAHSIASASSLSANRRSFLDESALSPHEYVVYTATFTKMKPSASGRPGLIDENDSLRFLREECAMSMADELEILSLFERTPLGLASGHFYAMLRLVSWAQQGKSASKELLFIQTLPARVSRNMATPQSATSATFASPSSVVSPTPRSQSAASSALSVAPTSTSKLLPPLKPQPLTKPPLLTPVREESQSSFTLPRPIEPDVAANSSSNKPPPAVPAKPSIPNLVAPKPKLAPAVNLEPTRKPAPPPTTTAAATSSATANPFRESNASSNPSGVTVAAPIATTAAPFIHPVTTAPSSASLLGFDPAPNPFKQSKPRLVKPTPVRASSPTSNPFRNGTPAVVASKLAADATDDAGSSSSSKSRQQHQYRWGGATSPPLPPRPHERNPPPLPPRHISPLIQAGLNARSEVRKARQALPPKTFSVIRSSSSKHGNQPPEKQPRLLNGQAVPSAPAPAPQGLPPPPQHHAKRRSVSGTKAFALTAAVTSSVSDPRRAVSEAGQTPSQEPLDGSQLQQPEPRKSLALHSIGTESGDSELAASSSLSKRPPPTIAPKPVYAKKPEAHNHGSSSTVKPTLPSWLREQQELQREALKSGLEPSVPPHIPPTEGGVRRSPRSTHRSVIDNLVDEAEAMSDEAVSGGLSPDRHNPFFSQPPPPPPPPLRTNSREWELQQALMRNEIDADRDEESHASNGARPLGRSKTLGSKAGPPPPRRRLDSFPQQQRGNVPEPANYAGGFKPNWEASNSGGLRLVPPSKQAKMLNVNSPQELVQEGIRPAPLKRTDSMSSNGGGGVGPLSPSGMAQNSTPHMVRRQSSLSNTIREKMSDILRLQDAPPKGQRQVDLLQQDIAHLVNKHDWLARAAGKPVRADRERLIDRGDHEEEEEEEGRGPTPADEPPEPDSNPFSSPPSTTLGRSRTVTDGGRHHRHNRVSSSGSHSATGGPASAGADSPKRGSSYTWSTKYLNNTNGIGLGTPSSKDQIDEAGESSLDNDQQQQHHHGHDQYQPRHGSDGYTQLS